MLLLTPITSPMVTRPPSPSAADAKEAAPAAAARGSTKQWRSPPCCDGCGAAKASGGVCTGCGGRFCAACMGSNTGSSSQGGSTEQGGAGACGNCDSLCNTCKPVACCFCEACRQQPAASRLCEACAGVCDACQRAACGPCRAEFTSCTSCGYAACEECRLQLQLQYGASGSADVGSLVGPSGSASCWCAPPLRTASNVRHVSSQRYQMSQLHPAFLSCSMEAAGLRDADDDTDDDALLLSHEEEDEDVGIMEQQQQGVPSGSFAAHSSAAAAGGADQHSSSGGGGAGGSGSSSANPPGLLGASRQGSQGFAGMLLDAKTLEAAIGSLPGVGGGHHASLPLSPSSSSHSSVGHYGSTGLVGGGVLGSIGLAGVLSNLRHPEHTLKGWLDGSH